MLPHPANDARVDYESIIPRDASAWQLITRCFAYVYYVRGALSQHT